ncbi:alpha/beta fold hydrolase [Spiroplasma tabanidicola]|uniref:Lysophospholipase n=1 Tax=Spiroplasma tabanidicola TaxID=324079 RepID=A0A6I6CAX3_9MOLU|nr:alpha/beta hydrolase [Spiroplasma tabanidicola]QGS52081.1 lysophospholipase [Spiroplasma tabanidicola]
MKEIKIKSFDNKELHTYIWDEVKNPVGVIHLVHGSAEHTLRYINFVEFLNKNNYIVIGSDHRGHGKTANLEENELGFFAKEDGWNIIIKDLHIINNFIKSTYKDLKVVIVGHSMGSFMVRNYISNYGDSVDGAIIVGTALYSSLVLNFGLGVAKKNQKKYGEKNVDKLIWKLSYKPLNAKFKKHGKTGVEWLSTDENVVKNFLDDPLAGQVFTSSAFKDLFFGLNQIQKQDYIDRIPKDLPIFIISGDKDSVGKFGKDPRKLQKIYKKNGLNSKLRLYLNMRHEILNEVGKEKVYRDINEFLESVLNYKSEYIDISKEENENENEKKIT